MIKFIGVTISKKKYYQINQYIQSDRLRVVDKDGGQVGVYSKSEALKLALDKKLDLVIVAPQAKPPVAKLVDFSNFRYLQKKKDQSSRKKSKGVELKEIRVTPFIADNDLQTRIKKSREFLTSGDRVRINVKFVGRQITRKEFGQEVLDRVISELSDISAVDQPPKMQGRLLTATLKPTKKSRKILDTPVGQD